MTSKKFQGSVLKDAITRLFGEGGRFRWLPFVAIAIYAGNLATAVLISLRGGILHELPEIAFGAIALTVGPVIAFGAARRYLPESIQANPRWYVREAALFATIMVGHLLTFTTIVAYYVLTAAVTPDGILLAAMTILIVVFTPGPTLAVLGIRRWAL